MGADPSSSSLFVMVVALLGLLLLVFMLVAVMLEVVSLQAISLAGSLLRRGIVSTTARVRFRPRRSRVFLPLRLYRDSPGRCRR